MDEGTWVNPESPMVASMPGTCAHAGCGGVIGWYETDDGTRNWAGAFIMEDGDILCSGCAGRS